MKHNRFKIEMHDSVCVARLIDKKILDETNIQVIGNQLFRLVDEEGHDKLIVDFSIVEYLSSVMFGKLITLERKIKEVHGKLYFCSIRADIYETFVITKLHKLFKIVDTLEDALQEI